MLNSSFLMPWQTGAAAFLPKPSQVRPRALGRVHVFRTDHKAFFSRTCRNSHSTLLSQVSSDMGLQYEVQKLAWVTWHWRYTTANSREGTELPWVGLASKKQDLLGTRNKMELHFRADLSSASDRFVNKVQNSRVVVGDHRNLPKWWTFVVNRGEKETSLFHAHSCSSVTFREMPVLLLWTHRQTGWWLGNLSLSLKGFSKRISTNNLVKIM